MQHPLAQDGESTANWAIKKPDFDGLKRLTCCARCGAPLPCGAHTKRKVFDLLKPSMHFLCDPCFEQLPD